MSKKKGKKKKVEGKLSPAEKMEKKRQREMYETIFINGKQKRVRRSPPEVDWSEIDDPIFFTQNEMWEELHAWEQRRDSFTEQQDSGRRTDRGSGMIDDDDVPF